MSWMMDKAKGEERELLNFTSRMFNINFASVHNLSSVGFASLLAFNSPDDLCQ
jgi:type II secretory pathway component PulK